MEEKYHYVIVKYGVCFNLSHKVIIKPKWSGWYKKNKVLSKKQLNPILAANNFRDCTMEDIII